VQILSSVTSARLSVRSMPGKFVAFAAANINAMSGRLVDFKAGV
jgi:hypothetical protein